MKSGSPEIAVAKKRILLVDDHPVVRQGLARLINDEPDLAVCAEAQNAVEALQRAEAQLPDLAIIDISLGGSDGLEVIKELRSRVPRMLMLVLSMHDESLYAERVLRAGAKGYVTKQEAPEKLMTAIRRVLGGELYVSAQMSGKLMDLVSNPRQSMGDSPLDRLSDRELQVFRLIAVGMSMREIADKLLVSVKTVETHREHVKEKLKLRSAAELLRYAVQHHVDTK